jgi:3-oxocholest-4-en-26-oyl-CoA dehydrogenase alpha subunit
MGERHWLLPDVARDGHRRLDAAELHVLREELARADAPLVAAGTTAMVARVILAVGSGELEDEIVPAAMRGEIVIALGMSEPEAGSDVAAVQTRARPVDGGWVISGQKMFTTNAHLADHVFVLARTDPESERHRGLTTFLVPAGRDGFDAQAVFTISGERTNITYFDDVFVEDRWRIGEVGQGWGALMLALQEEHSTGFSPHLDRLLGEVERWAMTEDHGAATIERDTLRQELARSATELEVAQLLELRTTWMVANDHVPVAEGPMAKLFSTEALVRCAERLTALIGPDALRSRTDPTAIGAGRVEHGLRHSLGTTIYGGSSEVQRNLIAQFRCQLPRS